MSEDYFNCAEATVSIDSQVFSLFECNYKIEFDEEQISMEIFFETKSDNDEEVFYFSHKVKV